MAAHGRSASEDSVRAQVADAVGELRVGTALTDPNPVDRGKNGSKIHLVTERIGLPLPVGISAANTHDSQAL